MLTPALISELRSRGADLAGVGDLRELPPALRQGLPIGIAVAVKYPKEIIRGIAELPTRAYYDQYNAINAKLDAIVAAGADFLRAQGYLAIPQTREYVRQFETNYDSLLPHKTVATRAGLGWIGKSALLVTEEFGSALRISSLLTNAPLECAEPMNESRCGDCMICSAACGAILGRNWNVCLPRAEFFDAYACRKTARARALKGFGVEITQCGKCIAVCPWTQNYLGGG